MNANDVAALLATVTVAQVMSVYSGKKGRCYCGCSGNHRYASAHREAASKDRGYDVGDDEVSDREVKRVLNIVKKNFSVPEDVTPGNEPYHDGEDGFVSHFTAEVGERSYTIYMLPKS